MPDYTYTAHRFEPRDGANEKLLLFVASAVDIRAWAGVPRKAFDYLHGFQRTLDRGRVSDVSQYFSGDVKNVSPTSVVIGFTQPIEIEELAGGGGMVQVKFTMPEVDKMSMPELVESALEHLKKRLPKEVVDRIDADPKQAVVAALEVQDEGIDEDALGNSVEGSIDASADAKLGHICRTSMRNFEAIARAFLRSQPKMS